MIQKSMPYKRQDYDMRDTINGICVDLDFGIITFSTAARLMAKAYVPLGVTMRVLTRRSQRRIEIYPLRYNLIASL